MNYARLLSLADKRASEQKQLWIVGCSFSRGDGVSKHERYGQLISNTLNLPVSFLVDGGSSVEWAADQILRSDIRPGDVIIWGLTGSSRMEFVDQNYVLHHASAPNFNRIPNLSTFINRSFLVSNHMIYKTIISIEQVRNFLEKMSCKFILAVFPLNSADHDLQILDYTSKLKDAIILFNSDDATFIDCGTDNLHPGPLHHAWYANQILNHLGTS